MPDEKIQPIVLVGGRSRRFGRDKLFEPLSDGILVERPIRALRDAFGPVIALVGECDIGLRPLGDLAIPDCYPGRGPAGGILSALEFVATRDGPAGSVFVLAGDLPQVQRSLLRRILDRARSEPDAPAIVAQTARGLEPCIGIYRQTAAAALRASIAGESNAALPLHHVLDGLGTIGVDASDAETVNVNRPGDLTG